MLKTSPGGLSRPSALGSLEKRLTGREPADSAIPQSVRRSVRLMLVGGVLTALVGIFLIVATVADKNALTGADGKKLSDGAFSGDIAWIVVEYVIVVAMWVLMARYNRAGRSWARIVASVFAAISTYDSYSLVNGLSGGQSITVIGYVYIIFSLAVWAVGVVSVAMLWRSESGAYFKARSALAR
jgi:hypothetical protein